MEAETTRPPAPASRRTLTLIVAPIIVLMVIGTIGNAIHPALLKEDGHPLWLIAMEPRNRWLILTANRIDFLPFLLVAVFRRLLSDPLFFLLGHLYQDRAVAWAERRFDNGSGLIRKIESVFRRAAPVMVFLFPGALICVLAGATSMSPVLFAVLNVVGTICVVSAMYAFADVVEGPVDAVNGFYGDNFKWLLAVSILLTVFWLWDQKRKGKSELTAISDLEHELDAPERESEEDKPLS